MYPLALMTAWGVPVGIPVVDSPRCVRFGEALLRRRVKLVDEPLLLPGKLRAPRPLSLTSSGMPSVPRPLLQSPQR